nr:MAG: hypothetical protein [Lake Baikal virophage 8]
MTCLQDTYWFLYSNPNRDDYTIIHALVQRKSDGLIHPHAVIYNKTTGNIHEVSNRFKDKNVVIPFTLWIALGNVQKIKQYTMQELINILLERRIWDFYHLEEHLAKK